MRVQVRRGCVDVHAITIAFKIVLYSPNLHIGGPVQEQD
jgi:hypothetical protein